MLIQPLAEMKPECCALDAGAMIQLDEVAATSELVTDLVTHSGRGAGYQTNSKGHLPGGAICKKPNVLSPI
jgi:hypothetical protein